MGPRMDECHGKRGNRKSVWKEKERETEVETVVEFRNQNAIKRKCLGNSSRVEIRTFRKDKEDEKLLRFLKMANGKNNTIC